jgi:hypothetical protein
MRNLVMMLLCLRAMVMTWFVPAPSVVSRAHTDLEKSFTER